MSKRTFRTQASLDAEAVSRDAVAPFLTSRGYKVVDDNRHQTGNAISQEVTAIGPYGKWIKMRIRLCWRWERRRKGNRCSAAQLRARLVDNDWVLTLDTVVQRAKEKGITHMLLVQRSGNKFAYAALIPLSELKAIWKKQRDVSNKLIENGKMGRIKKNHAMNGDSPTVWLMDNRTPAAHAVADVLWNWPGVVDLVKFQRVDSSSISIVDDTYNDIPSVDYSDLGSDGAPRVKTESSHVKRDPRVRREVLKRARNGCERESCCDKRCYPGFLDVHHILGAEKSDRVWNCVALCPSCHREAHYGPENDRINDVLLKFSTQFKPKNVAKSQAGSGLVSCRRGQKGTNFRAAQWGRVLNLELR
jgi:5-methylcytosine-specific restriction protein A